MRINLEKNLIEEKVRSTDKESARCMEDLLLLLNNTFSLDYLIDTNGAQAYIFDVPKHTILCCFIVVRYDC